MATEKTTTAKKTATKATTKKVEKVDNIVEETKVKEDKKAVAPKTYSSSDRIPCQSVTAGKLIYYSTKTSERYEWSNYGDISEVLYEDLLSMKSAKSNFLYNPLFVILDEELLAQPSWKKIKELYEQVEVVDDAEDYLNQSPEKLRELLQNAPEGLRNTIKVTASQMIDNGELDSIRKVKILDEILGTDFASFIN